VQALALALGFLFVSLYGGVLGALESLLFGDLLGVDDGRVLLLGVVAVVTLALLALLARPLLFASVDPDVAAARGVPVKGLSLAFLLLLGLAVAATSQITGVLLVFALLVAPAASAQALTVRPLRSLVLTVALGLAIVWIGLGIAYFSTYPAGFFIATVAFAVYVLARLSAAARRRLRRIEPPAPAQEPCPEGVIA
jgi:zinc/manganese transport system permease protein